MEVTYKKTEWKDGHGHKLMEGTTEFPRKRVTVSEPMDGRDEAKIEVVLRQRLEMLAPEYAD